MFALISPENIRKFSDVFKWDQKGAFVRNRIIISLGLHPLAKYMFKNSDYQRYIGTLTIRCISHLVSEKCLYSEFFWSAISCIRTEYGPE